jgi:dTDP-3-amino-2,3,6-trideoxy-4-keto-D-glucose/dTDP-3-amino-3,4,6-trideoxy-alpha-D-glucose/dTDP-2,6-dideoxy-D-kanosamine transaminase
MAYRVPFVDPRAHYRRYRSEIDAAIGECLSSGDLIYRDQLRRFEENLAAFVGVRYAVGVNSGYHALHFALLGAGVGAGDEVVTVAHTFVATISAIVHCGATPVLVDVGPDYNMDPVSLERAITPRTRAILCVHLNGRLCAMDRIRALAERHRLAVIEDAAQSLGATYDGRRAGALGLAGCFSFYPFKILGGFGDGGALTTNDETVARMASLLRYNGEDRRTGEYHYHGYTALLDNVQAAVLDRKLVHLPSWIEHRRRVAERYRQGLTGLSGLRLPHYDESRQRDIFQNYVIRTPERDRLREYLHRSGVETLVHWPKPVWEHAALGLKDPQLDETGRICREVISLPMSAETTDEHVDITVQAIREFFA